MYDRPGKIMIGFTADLEPWQMNKVSGGENFRNIFSLYL